MKVEGKREENERRTMKSRRQKAEIRIHAHVGRESKLASTIPEMKDKEIHSKGMSWILH